MIRPLCLFAAVAFAAAAQPPDTLALPLDLPTLPELRPPTFEEPPPHDGPLMEVSVSRESYAIAPIPTDADAGFWVTIVHRPGTQFFPCPSETQKLSGGVWVLADSLGCGIDPAFLPLPESEGVAVSHLRLVPYFLRRVVSANGSGAYRVVFEVDGADRRPLPLEMRSSPPFRLYDFAGRHPQVVLEYETLDGWRALSAGLRGPESRREGPYFWGYSYGYASAEDAINRALTECRSEAPTHGGSECWVERLDSPSRADAPE
ncbi:MAG: hypothetical protein WBA11_06210 [Rubrivirga sp.]